MQQPLIQVAMTNLGLVSSASGIKHLFQDLAGVTGIPLAALLKAERRMTAIGSLLPLKSLFADPLVPKADGLRYRFGVKELRNRGTGPAYRSRRVQTCRFFLDVESDVGCLQVVIDMVVKERVSLQAPVEKTARLSLNYRVLKGTVHRSYRQTMTVSTPKPQPEVTRVNATVAAARPQTATQQLPQLPKQHSIPERTLTAQSAAA